MGTEVQVTAAEAVATTSAVQGMRKDEVPEELLPAAREAEWRAVRRAAQRAASREMRRVARREVRRAVATAAVRSRAARRPQTRTGPLRRRTGTGRRGPQRRGPRCCTQRHRCCGRRHCTTPAGRALARRPCWRAPRRRGPVQGWREEATAAAVTRGAARTSAARRPLICTCYPCRRTGMGRRGPQS